MPSSNLAKHAGLPGNILVVDDEPELRAGLRRVLLSDGHAVCEASSGAQALDVLGHCPVDVVLLDLGLPDRSGLEVLTEIRAANDRAVVLVFTGSDAVDDMHEALKRGAFAYLHKPSHPLTIQAQVSTAMQRARSAARQRFARAEVPPLETAAVLGELGVPLEQLPFHLARQLSHAWDLRHIETGAHVRRMAESTRRLALTLGRSEADAELLGRVAMLHDIGKIAIPDAILTKPGKLTDDEFSVMKRHAEIGSALLSGFDHPFLDLAARVARSHHERWDGSGYPDGLLREDCPWEGRLVGVVDVFDALGHARCYKAAWSRQQLVDFFEVQAGKLFDPEMAHALVASLPALEAVNSEYPDADAFDYASGTRLKVAYTAPELAGQKR